MFLALSIVAPAQVEKAENRIFSHGLTVALEKSSPAYAALEEDLHEAASSPPSETRSARSKQISINSGESFVGKAYSILAANSLEEKIALQKQMAETKKVKVVEISREELLQGLFLPLMTTFKQHPELQSKLVSSSAKVSSNSEATHVHIATQTPRPPPLATPADTSVDDAQPHLIKGLLEFEDGLALTSPTDEISVFQEIDGEKGTEGTAWLRQARYAIEIPNREGLLVAELRNEKGDLLGRGEIELIHLPLKKQTQYKVADITIKLHPVASGFSGQVLSAYSHNDVKKPVEDAQVEIAGLSHQFNTDKQGHFEDSQILRGSTVVVQAQHHGYWGALSLNDAGSSNALTLYPNRMLRAFFEFVKEMRPELKLDQNSALVWGKVTRSGKPVAGAHVSLMTTDEPLTPIYFNDLMIPDKNLTATSANGLYAFVPVPPGAHAVEVTDEGILSEPVVFPTAAKQVSNIDIETVSWKRMLVKSFDAFAPDTPVEADFYRMGFEQERRRTSSGLAEIKYIPSSSFLIINAIPALSEYAPVRINSSRNKTYGFVPQVKVSWIKNLIGGRRTPGTSIAVGFVKTDKPYQAFADVGGSAAVVYFDSQGNVSDSGVPGGGYLIFNLDSGFRTISVVAEGSEAVSAQTVLADSKFVNVINHMIR